MYLAWEEVLLSGYQIYLFVPFQGRLGEGRCFHGQVASRLVGIWCDLHLALVEAPWALDAICQLRWLQAWKLRNLTRSQIR